MIDYVSRMFGLSQYDAARKLIEDFNLPIEVKGNKELNTKERERIRREKAERDRIIQIRERFQRWCNQSIELLKSRLAEIEHVGISLIGKPPDIIFADEPTGALNSSSGKDVLDILTDCSKNGQSILMVNHDVNAALRANRILYLRDGMIAGDKELIPYQDEVDLEKRKADVLNWLSEMGW